VTGSGGRLHFGMVAGIKSERWPASNRNPRPDCVGIRNNDLDVVTGLRMGDYITDFIEDEARELGLIMADLRSWTPPTSTRRARRRRIAT
jgi:hypothetical protein